MTPERLQMIETLFESALDLKPDMRQAFIEQACGKDASLSGAVTRLVASYEEAGDFLEEVAFEESIKLIAEDQAGEEPGGRIGPYRLIREIGRGGMGTVYLAVRDDDQYQKQVAIKIVQRGQDIDFIIRRFKGERQILANLDHPNIAKLLDGGTTQDGLPYFVMEYIEGEPITKYSDSHRLSIKERLRLFRSICSAVHYAHQNLVIHRDLKPGNILVGADGLPKLLDFGIAKLLGPGASDGSADQTATVLMTPRYASPEQMRGAAITTSSDTYSLAVLLYELLTGHHPHRFNSDIPHEMARVICEEEPERPSASITAFNERRSTNTLFRTTLSHESNGGAHKSQPEKLPPEKLPPEKLLPQRLPRKKLRRRLAGDLDNIIMKALSKEPERRYASVEQFSEDIRRHLDGRPVIARRSTPLYRAGKFIKRHKAGVSAAALIGLALVAGLMATAWQARVAGNQRAKAESERARAERRFNDVRKLAGSFIFDLYDAIYKLPGSTPARELMVKKALEYLDSLAEEAGSDSTLQFELATAYIRVGDVQSNPYTPSLGDTAGALASNQKAIAILEEVAAKDSAGYQAQRKLVGAYVSKARLLSQLGDSRGAEESLGHALAIEEVFWKSAQTDKDFFDKLSFSYLMIAELFGRLNNKSMALTCYHRALEIAEKVVAGDPSNTKRRYQLMFAHAAMGDFLADKGDTAGALGSLREALSIQEYLVANNPAEEKLRLDPSFRHQLGETLLKTGDTEGAIENYRKCLKITEDYAAKAPPNMLIRRQLAVSHRKLGEGLHIAGKAAGALESFRKSLAITEEMVGADPANVQARGELIAINRAIGNTLLARKNWAGAFKNYRKALQTAEALAGVDTSNTKARAELANSYSDMGRAYAELASVAKAEGRRDRLREARSWYQKSLDLWQDLRSRNALAARHVRKPDEIAIEIGRCDEALEKAEKHR
jgi:eukaryotic-like serine/threonine-protein kinase